MWTGRQRFFVISLELICSDQTYKILHGHIGHNRNTFSYRHDSVFDNSAFKWGQSVTCLCAHPFFSECQPGQCFDEHATAVKLETSMMSLDPFPDADTRCTRQRRCFSCVRAEFLRRILSDIQTPIFHTLWWGQDSLYFYTIFNRFFWSSQSIFL